MAACDKCNKQNETLNNIGFCGHNICFECLCQYLDTLTHAKVVCPKEGCKRIIRDNLIRMCLSNDKLSLYDRLCCASNTRKCLIKDCPYLVACDGEDVHFFCEICKQPNCVKCNQLHERDLPCPSTKDINSAKFENDAKLYLLNQRKESLLKESHENELIPNSERFDCPICSSLILPRQGVSLRNCMDTICRQCLENTIAEVDNLRNMSCPITDCCRPLTERECIALIGKERFQNICLDLVKPIMSNCQKEDCKGLWDAKKFIGEHECELCHSVNCLACQDIHKDMSCKQFRLTRRYIDAEKFRKDLEARNKIICQKCQNMIIKSRGCNALRCSNCRLQVCAYSGLEVGPNGCKCRNSNRCHDGCNPGCIPDGDTPYEKELYKYFFDN